jgi:predicted dithiol-disulfide oxidoreductase (DUF899 family)
MTVQVAEYGVTEDQRKAWDELAAAHDRYTSVVRARPAEPVENFELTDSRGETVRLSDLFAGKSDLIVIHNMGGGCSYCTMWADGLNGLLPHLEDRAAVALVSPDSPDVQHRIAEERGWNFRMYSGSGHPFTEQLGFSQGDSMYPGFSTFHLNEDRSIDRISSDAFGPGDLYNAAWPMFEHLAGGPGDWSPKKRYSDK